MLFRSLALALALAFHGKVGLSIASLIINKTDARIKGAINRIRKKKKLFKKY